MEHFSEQTWADFARAVSAPEFSRDIKAHLLAGCPECMTSHTTWGKVSRMATDEAAYEPPENLVRVVKLGVKLGLGDKTTAKTQKWTLANLVFDSFAQPLLHGVRSGNANAGGTSSVWQVVYEAEGLTVDLRVTHRAQSKAAHLVGQIFDKLTVRPLQNNAIVELSKDQNNAIAASVVSAFGEFHIEFEPQDHLLLSIKAAGRNAVRIPLTNLKLR
jgi:hypothetical protein